MIVKQKPLVSVLTIYCIVSSIYLSFMIYNGYQVILKIWQVI